MSIKYFFNVPIQTRMARRIAKEPAFFSTSNPFIRGAHSKLVFNKHIYTQYSSNPYHAYKYGAPSALGTSVILPIAATTDDEISRKRHRKKKRLYFTDSRRFFSVSARSPASHLNNTQRPNFNTFKEDKVNEHQTDKSYDSYPNENTIPNSPPKTPEINRDVSVADSRDISLRSDDLNDTNIRLSRAGTRVDETEIQIDSEIEQDLNSKESAEQILEYPNTSNISEKKAETDLINSTSPISQNDNKTQQYIDSIHEAFSQNKFSLVIDLYRNSLSNEVVLPISTYNKVLQSISDLPSATSTMDKTMTMLLNVYENILNLKIRPTIETYTIVVKTLIDASIRVRKLKEIYSFNDVERRHGDHLLKQVKTYLNIFEQGDIYFKLALDIFIASYSSRKQLYPQHVYDDLLVGCILNGNVNKLSQIVLLMEQSNILRSDEFFLQLIKGYAIKRDYKSALAVYEEYRIIHKDSVHVPTEQFVYAALIDCFILCGKIDEANSFLHKVTNAIKHKTGFVETLKVIADGYVTSLAKVNMVDEAWDYVLHIDSTESLLPVSVATVGEVLSAACRTNNFKKASEIYNWLASIDDVNSQAFWSWRSDYLAFAFKNEMINEIMKILKEATIRGAVFDETTVLKVFELLLKRHENSTAMELFNSQSLSIVKEIAKYESNATAFDLSITEIEQKISANFFTQIVLILRRNDRLDTNTALTLTRTPLFSASFFSNVNPDCRGWYMILQKIWDARFTNDEQFIEAFSSNKFLLKEMVLLHINLYKHSKTNKTFMISKDQTEQIANYLIIFVKDLIILKSSLNENFVTSLKEALTLMDEKGKPVLDDLIEARLDEWTNESDKASITIPTNSSPGLISRATSGSTNITSEASVNKHMSSAIPNYNSEISNTIIFLLKSEEKYSLAIRRFEAAIKNHVLLDPKVFIAVIESSHNRKLFRLIKFAVQKATEQLPSPLSTSHGWEIWVDIYRAVISNSADFDYDYAFNAYQKLLSMSAFPNATGYGKLISCKHLGTHDEATEAINLFTEAKTNGVRPNTFLYNVLLSKLAKARRIKDALIFFRDMNTTNTNKSNITYGTMISACCRVGDEEKAKELFQEMESSARYEPNIAPYNMMLQFYVHAKGDRNSALKIYNKVRALKLKPSSHTYKILIDMYTKINPINIKDADNVLKIIVEDENYITSKHYAALIFARGVGMKDLEAAKSFFKMIVTEKQLIRPDSAIFQAMLESYVVNDHISDTTELWDSMKKYGVSLNVHMISILIRGWAKVDLSSSEELFNLTVKENRSEPSSYESMVRTYLYAGKVDQAWEVFNLMKSKGYPPLVVAKVERLINNSNDMSKENKEDILLQSIFRQDVYSLAGGSPLGLKKDMDDYGSRLLSTDSSNL